MQPDSTAPHLFAELTGRAQTRALASVTAALPTWRGEPGAADQLATALTTTLATALDLGGASDLEVTVWDAHRCRWGITATLSPATAPALPWASGIPVVRVCPPCRIRLDHDGEPPDPQAARRMLAAVQDGIAQAWHLAYQQVTACHALEWIAARQPRFSPAGTPAPGWL